MAYAVIRVRGQPDVNYDIEHTMELLRLTRVNHCVVIPENDAMKGMLQKAKDYITWGEINEETLVDMIKVRGRLEGDEPINAETLGDNDFVKTPEEMAKAILADEFKANVKNNGIKPVFRLYPPIKGYEGNKRSWKNGGALGYRGDAINDLIARML